MKQSAHLMRGYVRSDFVNESFDEDNWQIKAKESHVGSVQVVQE